MTIRLPKLYTAIEATWPPAGRWSQAGWTFRDGAGGGKRVSAATAEGQIGPAQIDAAMQVMVQRAERPLFMVRAGETTLDRALDAVGLEVIDPVVIYTAPISTLTDQAIPPVTTFVVWEPLAIMREIWAAGGIGPARINVMERAAQKTAIFGRWKMRPAGAAFAALHEDICMVHAVEVLPAHRRHGMAQWMMRAAAFWAQTRGARHISVLCVADNIAANALYTALGFVETGRYHYRIAPRE